VDASQVVLLCQASVKIDALCRRIAELTLWGPGVSVPRFIETDRRQSHALRVMMEVTANEMTAAGFPAGFPQHSQ
jgi:hypothetical protein